MMLSTKTDGTIHGDVGVRRQRQSTVGRRLYPSATGRFWSSGIKGVAVVKGNQQCGSLWNGMTAGNGAIIH